MIGFTGNGETFVTGGSGKASCSSVAGHSGGSGIDVHNSNTGAVSCSFARGPRSKSDNIYVPRYLFFEPELFSSYWNINNHNRMALTDLHKRYFR